MKDNTKITLTVKQLKKLLFESENKGLVDFNNRPPKIKEKYTITLKDIEETLPSLEQKSKEADTEFERVVYDNILNDLKDAKKIMTDKNIKELFSFSFANDLKNFMPPNLPKFILDCLDEEYLKRTLFNSYLGEVKISHFKYYYLK